MVLNFDGGILHVDTFTANFAFLKKVFQEQKSTLFLVLSALMLLMASTTFPNSGTKR